MVKKVGYMGIGVTRWHLGPHSQLTFASPTSNSPPASYSLLRPISHAPLLLLTTPTTTYLGRTTPITTHTHHKHESNHPSHARFSVVPPPSHPRQSPGSPSPSVTLICFGSVVVFGLRFCLMPQSGLCCSTLWLSDFVGLTVVRPGFVKGEGDASKMTLLRESEFNFRGSILVFEGNEVRYTGERKSGKKSGKERESEWRGQLVEKNEYDKYKFVLRFPFLS
ncbi:unnamed protein product [Sphenostylis stenocarpa]|uniref:Uncharacterized protein n=1 Tax=Sphenostylis stenocarpa TaxID=92480 RepID=A0AA86TEL1_9FABA|nr:unnamed protein product [Sphenostylis stenocarpa]